MEYEPVAVRREDERDLQDFRVLQSLLHAVAYRVVVVLRLDDGNRDVRLVVEDVVGELRLPPSRHLPANMDLATSEVHLAPDLLVVVPSRSLNGRGDELRADVCFAEALLVHAVRLALW